MDQRVIFHVDMDAFFASVEILKNPTLRGKPVVVGGNPESRGVVSTCSYEARVFGIHSSMSLSEAKRRCPKAIFLECDFSTYRHYSDQVMELLHRLTPCVEEVGIDEAYLDISQVVSRYPSAYALAERLKQAIFKRTQLPCSIGVAPNKLLAKMASSAAKPNGIREVLPGREREFLAPLPIGSLPGVGEKTREELQQDGLKKIGDLHVMTMEELIDQYGSRGYWFFMASQGRHNSPVEWEPSIPKSLGAETTFETDQTDLVFLRQALLELTEKTWRHLCDHQMRTRGFCLKLRDERFRTITRSRMLFSDTRELSTLKREALLFFDAVYRGHPPLRLLGISLRPLAYEYWQPTLWNWESDKVR